MPGKRVLSVVGGQKLVTRWDPRSRAGAVAVRSNSAHDPEALKAIADSVQGWAAYSNVEGEVENIETSSIKGAYDWKAYLQEETQLAQERDDRVERKPAKKPSAVASSVPAHWYV